ncbi:MAG: hypothetical protein ACHQ4H_08790 [Ktedonobacterales bacterium]
MATEVDTETKIRGKALATAGGITTILAVIATAIPIGYWLIAKATGSIKLTTLDQVKSLATNGSIATIVAIGIGIISLIICAVALVLAVRVARVIATVVTLAVLVAAVLFGVLYVRPHVSDLNALSNTTEPFAQSLQDNCGTPLNQTTSDLRDALNQTQGAANDAAFAAAMGVAVPKLQADAAKLGNASNKLSTLTVPDPKYQQLYSDCVSSVKAEVGFLTNSSAITLPAPYNAITASLSGIDLLKDSALVALNQVPGLTVPAGSIEPLVAYALQQAVFAKSNLAAEGTALQQDIRTRLTNDCAPFGVDADNIVS